MRPLSGLDIRISAPMADPHGSTDLLWTLFVTQAHDDGISARGGVMFRAAADSTPQEMIAAMSTGIKGLVA